jgi:putative transposase
VRAGIIKEAGRYEWSSALAHTGAADTAGILHTDTWRGITTPKSWKAYLAMREDDLKIELNRAKTSRGRPLGSDSFISKLETCVGRRLRPLPTGRPRKD